MTKKLKRPLGLILSIIMVISLFAIMTITASARGSFADGLGALDKYSVSLDGDIAINYFMELSDNVIEHKDAAYVQFTIPDETETETQKMLVKDAQIREVNGNIYYVFKCKVSAANMTAPITAQIVDGENFGAEYTGSFKKYAEEELNDPECDEITSKLIKTMLNYGAASQVYFDVNTEKLANASLSDEDKVIADVTPAMINVNTPKYDLPKGVKFAGATLSLKSETSLSIYLTSKKEVKEAQCGDYTVETDKSGSYKVLRIRGIKAENLGNDLTVNFKINDNLYSVTYNPTYYCRSVLMNSSADANLKTAVKVLHWYRQAAVEYYDYYSELKSRSIDIIFKANGGSGEMDNQSVNFDSTVNLNENAFTKFGYTFAGWSKTTDGNAIYNDGSYFTMASLEPVTLYAQWTANNYDVVFNANGGTGTMEDQSIAYDSTENLKANAFTRNNYVFKGWSTTSDGNVVYTDGAEYTMTTEGATLYAQWDYLYTVTFNGNGATSGTMSDIYRTYGGTFTVQNDFTRTGYTFKDFYSYVKAGSSWSGTGNRYNVGDTVTVTNNLMLEAEWTVNNYDVVFDANGGEGNMANQTFTFGSSANLNENTFTRIDHAFKCWNTKPDGTGTSYENSTSYTMQTEGGITLYAQWERLYSYRDYDATTGKFVTKQHTATPLTSKTDMHMLNDGWYVVEGNVTYANRMIISNGRSGATVNIILSDGATLNANNCIMVRNSEILNIYCQENGTGKLIAQSNDVGGAAIGGNSGPGGTPGIINIYGGEITAVSNIQGCSAIGGGSKSGSTVQNNNTINIYGGTVAATGGLDAAGIGGGNGGAGGNINIYGGTVTANTSGCGAGIGGGDAGAGGNINIYGGTVTAANTDGCGAGIGGGWSGTGGNINIYGGTVTATGGNRAAGIGGGYKGAGGTVNIYGGTVTANGGTYNGQSASGIGKGFGGSSEGTLTVADGLTVFGGTSANQTKVIASPYNSRPRYMIVKKELKVETFEASVIPSSQSWPIKYSLTDFKLQFRMKTNIDNEIYIASGGDNYAVIVTALTGKNIEKLEVKLGNWLASANGQYLISNKGNVVFPPTVGNGSVITINDINSTSVKLNLSQNATDIASIKVYYYN